MAKKKKSAAAKKSEFGSSPFSDLKGLSVPGEKASEQEPARPVVENEQEQPVSFAEEMARLGVDRFDPTVETGETDAEDSHDDRRQTVAQSEEDEFLQAMGELQVNFSDQYPDRDVPPSASARRMKQLKQGKLVPQATLDLHGLKRSEVAERIGFFLQDAVHHGWQTVLVITGRGLHSADGEPVLRSEAERYLAGKGRDQVAEWGRAPKKYGGDGALILFLRKKSG